MKITAPSLEKTRLLTGPLNPGSVEVSEERAYFERMKRFVTELNADSRFTRDKTTGILREVLITAINVIAWDHVCHIIPPSLKKSDRKVTVTGPVTTYKSDCGKEVGHVYQGVSLDERYYIAFDRDMSSNSTTIEVLDIQNQDKTQKIAMASAPRLCTVSITSTPEYDKPIVQSISFDGINLSKIDNSHQYNTVPCSSAGTLGERIIGRGYNSENRPSTQFNPADFQ